MGVLSCYRRWPSGSIAYLIEVSVGSLHRLSALPFLGLWHTLEMLLPDHNWNSFSIPCHATYLLLTCYSLPTLLPNTSILSATQFPHSISDIDFIPPSEKDSHIFTKAYLLPFFLNLWTLLWLSCKFWIISTYKWVHTMHDFLDQGYLTLDNIFWFHPFDCLIYDFLGFNTWVVI